MNLPECLLRMSCDTPPPCRPRQALSRSLCAASPGPSRQCLPPRAPLTWSSLRVLRKPAVCVVR